MAFDITGELSKILSSKEGLEIISDFLYEKNGYMPIITRLDSDGGTILIQNYVFGNGPKIPHRTELTITIGLSAERGYVNPCCDKDGNNFAFELSVFVKELAPKLILQKQREEKINSIL